MPEYLLFIGLGKRIPERNWPMVKSTTRAAHKRRKGGSELGPKPTQRGSQGRGVGFWPSKEERKEARKQGTKKKTSALYGTLAKTCTKHS